MDGGLSLGAVSVLLGHHRMFSFKGGNSVLNDSVVCSVFLSETLALLTLSSLPSFIFLCVFQLYFFSFVGNIFFSHNIF